MRELDLIIHLPPCGRGIGPCKAVIETGPAGMTSYAVSRVDASRLIVGVATMHEPLPHRSTIAGTARRLPS